ncbi:hypothetical protein [Kineococcus aurantiacus]|uniref:Uncharacterized protein n=1 Tax=Kineococcus aurantiacus TaxID=37633 RepID=A0A7Y9ASS1_9ACTN|nr:hypothetical protein [Kineococcus aurantiacus]NYD21377.1 hypothetical protein [Kineococcus aurantiacus]
MSPHTADLGLGEYDPELLDGDPRVVWLVLVQTPRGAFRSPFLTMGAAAKRVRRARNRGWSARLVPCELWPLDPEAPIDPYNLPAPDPEAEVGRPRRARAARIDLVPATPSATPGATS